MICQDFETAHDLQALEYLVETLSQAGLSLCRDVRLQAIQLKSLESELDVDSRVQEVSEVSLCCVEKLLMESRRATERLEKSRAKGLARLVQSHQIAQKRT